MISNDNFIRIENVKFQHSYPVFGTDVEVDGIKYLVNAIVCYKFEALDDIKHAYFAEYINNDGIIDVAFINSNYDSLQLDGVDTGTLIKE